MKLSIVIPTIGRKDKIKASLDALYPQIERNKCSVELIVVDNASNDGTQEFIQDYKLTHDLLKYYRFEDRGDFVVSFCRATEKATAEYVLLFGDDDIPCPFYIDYILDCINRYPDVSLFYYGTMVGRDSGDGSFKDINYRCTHIHDSGEKVFTNSEFAKKYMLSPGFISATVFEKRIWNEGLEGLPDEITGFPQLAIWYYGNRNGNCFYSVFPSVLERQPLNRDYLEKTPMYTLIEHPRLALLLKEWGICDEKIKISIRGFVYNLLIASSYKKRYKPLCKTICEYQNSLIRKILTYLIIYLTPSFVVHKLRNFVFKR